MLKVVQDAKASNENTASSSLLDESVRNGERQRFSSAILPAWARKSPRVAEVLPLLYLHGLSSDLGPARSSRTASSSNDPTNQQAVTPTRMTH